MNTTTYYNNCAGDALNMSQLYLGTADWLDKQWTNISSI